GPRLAAVGQRRPCLFGLFGLFGQVGLGVLVALGHGGGDIMIAPRRGALRPVMKAHWSLLAIALVATSFGCRRGERVAPAARPAGPRAAADASPTVPEADLQPPAAPRGRQISLFYSSNLQGKYAPCNCAVEPLGGLARRATIVDRGRAEADATVVVDAGDLFKPEGTEAETERQGRLLAAGLARAGLDAFTPGETDLAIGVPRLQKLDRKSTRLNSSH